MSVEEKKALSFQNLPENACAFMLSGQGSQKPGMGTDLQELPQVAATFALASEVFGFDLVKIISEGDAQTINDTRYAQPTLCALSLGIARALMAQGLRPHAVLGFSLGQIGALAVSGMLSDEETLALVAKRTELMSQAALEYPGAMSALLKGSDEEVEQVCRECAQGQVLVPANYNSPGQVVISGEVEAIERAETTWIEKGGRASRLKTSGAFHSPLMQDAACGLADYLKELHFKEASIPLICNVDAAPLSADEAAEHLVLQITHPVRFSAGVRVLFDAGIHNFIEVGYGGVLKNLVKRIEKEASRECVSDMPSFLSCLDAYTTQIGD